MIWLSTEIRKEDWLKNEKTRFLQRDHCAADQNAPCQSRPLDPDILKFIPSRFAKSTAHSLTWFFSLFFIRNEVCLMNVNWFVAIISFLPASLSLRWCLFHQNRSIGQKRQECSIIPDTDSFSFYQSFVDSALFYQQLRMEVVDQECTDWCCDDDCQYRNR